jgi:MFS family permease
MSELSVSQPLVTTASTTEVAAHETPTRNVSLVFQLSLSAANMAFFLTYYPIIQLLIPTQVTGYDSANAATNLALVGVVGALASLIGNPLIGALSDRTTSRMGRRKPWLAGGLITTLAAMALMANAPGVGVLALAWAVQQFCASAVYSALCALIPDRVPEKQRGTVSGVVGLSLPLAIIVGAILIGNVIADVKTGYYTLMTIVVVVIGLFIATLRDTHLPKEARPPLQFRQFLSGFWISPRRYPDFAFAWITRFLVILGYSLGTGSFTFLYLQNIIHYSTLFPGHEVKEGAATSLLIGTLILLPTTVVFGVISDRVGRRKIFVMGSSAVIAIGLAILAVAPSWTAVQIASAVIGFGFGAYLSVDVAMITQVLPSATSRAKDLGIINIANSLPPTIAPIIGAIIINSLGVTNFGAYVVLFITGAILTLLGAVLVRPIKSVR